MAKSSEPSGAKAKRTTMELAKGYQGSRGRHHRAANEQVMHSLRYAYRDRRARKGDFRALWIARINAAARAEGMTYNRFISSLRQAGIQVDRKVLADIAVTDPRTAASLVSSAREASTTGRGLADGRTADGRDHQSQQPRGAGRRAGSPARPRELSRSLPAGGPRGDPGPRSTPASRAAAGHRAGRDAADLVSLARQRGAQVALVAEPVLSALAAPPLLRGWWRWCRACSGPWTTFPPPRPGLRAGRGPRPRQRRHRAAGGRRLRRRRRGHDQGVGRPPQSPPSGPGRRRRCSTCRWSPGRPG